MRPAASHPLVLIAVVAGCASGGGSPTPAPAAGAATTATATSTPRAPRIRANVISEEEIAALNGSAQTAYDVIQRLRPAMMRSRAGTIEGTGSSNERGVGDAIQVEPVVYLESNRTGTLSTLRQMGYETLREIRYLSASDATTLFGTGHGSGVIQVFLKKGR